MQSTPGMVERGDYGSGFAEMRSTARTSTELITALESQECTRMDPQHIGSSMESVLRGFPAETGPINRSAVLLHPRRAMHAILYGSPDGIDRTLEEIKRLQLATLDEDGCIGTDEQERLHDSLEQSELALTQLREAKQRPGQQVLRFQEPVLVYERQTDGSIASDAQGSWRVGSFTLSTMTVGEVLCGALQGIIHAVPRVGIVELGNRSFLVMQYSLLPCWGD